MTCWTTLALPIGGMKRVLLRVEGMTCGGGRNTGSGAGGRKELQGVSNGDPSVGLPGFRW